MKPFFLIIISALIIVSGATLSSCGGMSNAEAKLRFYELRSYNHFVYFMETHDSLKYISGYDLSTMSDSSQRIQPLYDLYHLITSTWGEQYRLYDSLEHKVEYFKGGGASAWTEFKGTFIAQLPESGSFRTHSIRLIYNIREGATPLESDRNMIIAALGFIDNNWRYENFIISVSYGWEGNIRVIKEVIATASY